MSVCHIVPTVPPAFNGVGDYAYQLWKHWPGERPAWTMLTREVPEGAEEHWPEVSIRSFEINREGLSKALERTSADTAVLHYEGYSYANRGIPTWMPRALEDWKKRTGGRLVVIFHELFATGKPWTSAFWVSPIQKQIVRELAGLADRWVSSNLRAMELLGEVLRVDMSKGVMIPIGSNIEPVREPDWERPWPPEVGGKLRLVVFGALGTRMRAFQAHKGLLAALASEGMLESVTVLGMQRDGSSPVADAIAQIVGPDLPVLRRFNLPSSEVSETLLEQHVGLMSNWHSILYKSGVFAAYCVHGVLPIIPAEPGTPPGPYLVNDDEHPERCIEALRRAGAIVADELRLAAERETWTELAAACGAVAV